jgi:hypothetical protein
VSKNGDADKWIALSIRKRGNPIMAALSRFHRRLLGELPYLPSTAIIPLQVAAVIEGCSTKHIRRNYKLEQISKWRKGVRKMYLRGAGEPVTA